MVRTVPELLAPAGGPPQFMTALAAGADALYCGFGTSLNARRGARSFDSNTFADACRRAHLAGAFVYVTVNVAIRDDELPTALGMVRRAWLLGADAFIVQDWGLFCELRQRWPHIACHISTQANVHDTRAVRWCKEHGAQRVTLSRELSIPELRTLAQEGVELECFCHGAICICYSGVCQMSSCAGDRSANRGTCAQPCRLPYELVDDKGAVLTAPDRGRPLCPKDFYSFEDLASLADAGVCSLKIEGRLKAPDYVYSVISAYREQLDDLAHARPVSEATLAERRTRLKRAFNRDFTNAYLQGTSGDELMSYERSNNRGELVGTVVDSRSLGTVKVRRGGGGGGRERLRTARVAEVDILLDKPVGKGDLLEIRPINDPSQFLTAYAQGDAAAGEVITCRTARAQEQGSLVRVIRSQEAMDAGARTSELEIPRRRAVCAFVRARMGEPFEVELQTADGLFAAKACGFVVEAARTRAVTHGDLVEHVGRMGATPFEPVSCEVSLDEGCGMAFSAVHKVRAEACAALERAILASYESRELDDGLLGLVQARNEAWDEAPEPVSVDDVQIRVLAASAEAARMALDAGAAAVYATTDALAHGSWPEVTVPVLDEVCREGDHARLDPWVREGRPVAVGNVSELALAQTMGAAPQIRGCIPVHNASCRSFLVREGASGIWLSSELSLDEIRQVARQAEVPMGFVVYGRPRAMTTEHCVLQAADRCAHACDRCALRAQQTFLKNDAGDLFPVRTDEQGRSRVYAAHVLDATPYVPQLVAAGITWMGVDATLLSPEEMVAAVRRVTRAVAAWRDGKKLPPRLPGTTSGHLFQPIQ